MALSRVSSRVLAQAHLKAKTRRRRLVVLSSRHLQPLSHRTRPSLKTMPLDKHALPESRPKIAIKLKEPSNKEDPPHCPELDHQLLYHDTIGASVQRLQIPCVPATASDEAMHFKSTAKRRLDELLNDPINFVPATKATMSTEPTHKRRRLHTQEPTGRSHIVANLDSDFSRKDLGAIGLPNDTGVQCYRRSCLQALMNLPVFVQWIKRHGTSQKYRCPQSGCLACALRKLADQYWPTGGNKQSQKYVNEAVRNFDKAISRLPNCPGTGSAKYQQQDAHEFMIFILNNLSDTLHDKKVYMPRDEFEALFGLKCSARRTCHNCGHQETSGPWVWTNTQINLREPGKGLGFKRYLDANFQDEVAIDCEGCKKRKHTRKHFILSAPEILPIQLVRFNSKFKPTRFGDVKQVFHKISDPVKFPLYLDLSDYCDDDENGKRLQQSGTLRYKLRSTVIHQGDSRSSGHYVANVVSPKGIEHISDMHVRPHISVQELLRPIDSGGGTPYILTYVRDH
ncbi:hypothetical protein DBV05_g1759 [Lasiodiplodia theobromae]|uniref:USP domain-containing protein n=1 Tax=Lasiodiplodia theobromae TaxID=45133 RepID=A0A5N5DNU9_9PEZI|nr:hypothetical protein DBV05_g1759 [Lasiodiplodia theobromae]